MREITLNSVTAYVPEEVCYIGDDNYVDFISTSALGEVSVEISSVAAHTERLVYSSPLNKIRINIREALLPHIEAAGDVEIWGEIGVSADGSYKQFYLLIHKGKTLATRSHYAEGCALTSADNDTSYFFIPAAGGITVHGGVNDGIRFTTPRATYVGVWGGVESVTIDTITAWTLRAKITDPDTPGYLVTFDLTDADEEVYIAGQTCERYTYEYNGTTYSVYVSKHGGVPTVGKGVLDGNGVRVGQITDVTITGSTPIFRYEMGRFSEDATQWDVRIQRTCAKEHEVVVSWHNADGMLRMASGELLSDGMESEGTPMLRASDANIRSFSWRHIDKVRQTIVVGFANIPHDAFVEDILMSDEVTVSTPDGSAALPAVPVTKKLGKIDDNDVSIELEVLS